MLCVRFYPDCPDHRAGIRSLLVKPPIQLNYTNTPPADRLRRVDIVLVFLALIFVALFLIIIVA